MRVRETRPRTQQTFLPPVAEHLCHARGCSRAVPPRLLMCARHWKMVPGEIQKAVWKHYRRGQEIDKQPSKEYLEAARQAIRSVAEQEGLQ